MSDNWSSAIVRLSKSQEGASIFNRKVVLAAGLLAVAVGVAWINWPRRVETFPALFPLVLNGKADEVRAAVSWSSAAVRAVDIDGNTALHLAAITGQQELVDFLLAKGASPDVPNHKGYTPLLYGVWAAQHQGAIVKAIIAAGANPKQKLSDGKTALELAVQTRNLSPEVRQLLTQGSAVKGNVRLAAAGG